MNRRSNVFALERPFELPSFGTNAVSVSLGNSAIAGIGGLTSRQGAPLERSGVVVSALLGES